MGYTMIEELRNQIGNEGKQKTKTGSHTILREGMMVLESRSLASSGS